MSKMKFSKKMVYSTLTAIGLVGSAGGIIGGVVANNNLQTSQTIANLDNQISNINLYDSSTNTNTSNQTNSNVDTSNADTYNTEFLKDLNNNKYPNDVDYTTTFSQKNDIYYLDGDAQYNINFNDTNTTFTDTNQDNINVDPIFIDASNNAVLGYNGDLTTNSVLNTKKDSVEISNESKGNLDSNLYNTLKNAMIDFRHEWFNELYSAYSKYLEPYNNDFYVTKITPETDYVGFEYSGQTGSWQNFWDQKGDNADPNSDYAGEITGDTSFNFKSDNNYWGFLDNYIARYAEYYPNFTSFIQQMNQNFNLIDTSYAQDGFAWLIQPNWKLQHTFYASSYDKNDAYNGMYGYLDDNSYNVIDEYGDVVFSPKLNLENTDASNATTEFNAKGYFGPYSFSNTPATIWTGYDETDSVVSKEINENNTVTYYIIKNIKPIIGQTYNFAPNNNTLITNILNSPNSSETIKTMPDNSNFYGLYTHSHTTHDGGEDMYRGLLNWTLEKAPIYSIDPYTYLLNIDGNNVVDTNGNITNSNDLFINKYNNANDVINSYYFAHNTDPTNPVNDIIEDYPNYSAQRVWAEQDVLDLYKQPQLINIIQQINNDKNNFTVSNLTGSDGVQIVDGSSTSGKNYSDSQVFGANTPFTISKIILPQQFNTNYGLFTTTVNGSNGTNITYLFNNFLPILASQIVVDPTSALSSYTNPNSTTGVYTNQLDNTNGELKFKLSENFGQLLSIANIYSTYKNLIEGLNPTDYGLENSQNYNVINELKNNFENLNFTDTQTSLLNDLQKNINNNDKVINDANEINTQVINNQNSTNLLNLISKIFNCDPNILIDSNGNLTNDVKQTLILLPIATKDAMSNLDIVANVSYGDGKQITPNSPDNDGTIIWDASDPNNNNQGTFEPISIDSAFKNTTNYNLTGNNDAEINVSNIHFEYKDGSTIKDTNDAYTDNMNFINNGANNNLDYMLNEYNSYYPNNSSISIDDTTNTLTYKLHYNPGFANYGLSIPDQYINTQGIPITDKEDVNGIVANDYTTSNLNIKTIDVAIQNFFTAQIADKEILQLDSTATKVIKTMNDVDTTYKTTIEQITNNNVTPNDTTGNFYAIVTITNSQNFSNPTGSGNANNQISMDDGTLVPMWYLSENINNTQQRTYLVEMNASKKDVNLSQISFESGASGDNTITWKMTNPSNYYYNDDTNSSSISLDANGNIEQNQTITINSTNYINWTNNIDYSDTSSSSYMNFKTTLSMWFYSNYQKTVSSYTINDLSDNNYTINVILNM